MVLWYEIKEQASREGRPASELVREAMTEYLAKRKEPKRRLSFIGVGRSGKTDVAQNDERILREEFAKAAAKRPRETSRGNHS